jgi:subtilisin
VPDAIPDKLSENVPQLVVMVLVVGAVLGFALRLLIRQAEQMGEVLRKMADRHEAAVTRHENAEDRQFAAVAIQTEAINAQTKSNEAQTRTLDVLARTVEGLSRHLDQADPLHTLSHEMKTMSILSEHDIHLGVPGGIANPIFMEQDELEACGLLSETRPWTHNIHGVDALHAAGHFGSPRVLIAVLDTGVQADHPDLTKINIGQSLDFVREGLNDGNGHGTHCTGTVAGINEQINRVMGVAPQCTVVHYKVLSNRGSGSGADISRAIRHVASLTGYDAKIISGSFGAGGEDPQISAAVREAHRAGVIQIYAAGNSGPNSPNWPGMLAEVIAVGASDRNGNVAPFSSSHGDYVDATGGGVDIPSAYPRNRIAVLSGTSMATPLVAGIVGVAVSYAIKQTGVIPTDAQVKQAMYATCVPHTASGRDSRGGYGRVRGPEFADRLARMIEKPKPEPEPKPEPAPDKVTRLSVPKGTERIEITLV